MTVQPRVSVGEWVYLTAVMIAGAVIIVVSLHQMLVRPVAYGWFVLAALTLLSGFATLRMPSAPVSFSISDAFTMTAALLFGPSGGTIAVALDGLAISLRLARRPLPMRRLLFNLTAPALAMWIAAQAFFALARVGPLSDHPELAGDVLLPLFLFAALYFVLNTGLIAVAVALDQRAPVVSIWRQHFLGLWLTYFGGASIAALVIVLVYSRRPDFKLLALVLPLPLILYLMFRSVVDRLQEHLNHLDSLNRMHLATIDTLAQAIDAKDQITHGHLRRVERYAIRLAQEVGVTDEAQMRALAAAALLHDVGKLAVPEHILNKPARLTRAEFDKVKEHAEVGAQILSSIDFPYPVVPIVRHHHENWDGSGYPEGLKGTSIPIGARILSVVDCFDALTSDRPYRPKLANPVALRVVQERRGTMYDPEVVDGFVRVYPQIASDTGEIPPDVRAFHPIVDEETECAASSGDPAAAAAAIAAAFELGTACSADADLDTICDRMRSALTRVMPVCAVALYGYDSSADRLVVRCAAGLHAEALRHLTMELGQRVSGWVAASRQSIVNAHAVLDLGDLQRTLEPPLQTCLSVPLIEREELVGTLTIYSTVADAFTDRHRWILEEIARHLASRIRQRMN